MKGPMPVLVGTVSVEKQRYLSDQRVATRGPARVLNARHHEREASIVAEAGRKGAVTVATNMAGRGTDIMLGGSPEFRAVQDLKARGLDPEETPGLRSGLGRGVCRGRKAVAAEHDEVRWAAGGLSTSWAPRAPREPPHRQPVRGRSGRQGDPGESRFYLSLRTTSCGSSTPAWSSGSCFPPAWPRMCRSSQDGLALDQSHGPRSGAQNYEGPARTSSVRRRPQPPAHRHLRRASPRVLGRGPAG